MNGVANSAVFFIIGPKGDDEYPLCIVPPLSLSVPCAAGYPIAADILNM